MTGVGAADGVWPFFNIATVPVAESAITVVLGELKEQLLPLHIVKTGLTAPPRLSVAVTCPR